MPSDRHRAIVESSPDLTALLSADGVVLYAAPTMRALLANGAGAEGRLLREAVHPEDLESVAELVDAAVRAAGAPVRCVLRVQTEAAEWRHVEFLAVGRLEEPALRGILVSGRDVTERAALEQRLRFDAHHDTLTGLANRTLFRERVAEALAVPDRRPESVAVMIVDLDRFKSVNDTLGHDAGDELLRVVAARLLSATRGSDTVARLGGDEFAVLLTGLSGPNDVLPVLGRVAALLRQPVAVRGREVQASGSTGVALSGADADAAELMRRADVAMYAAKRKEDGEGVRFYEPAMQAGVDDQAALELDLRRAVERGELRLAYQPLVDLATRVAYGVEALVRWEHPERGMLAPAHFIPLAEASGLVVPVGRWVLHEACATVAGWQQQRGAADPLLLSVNVAAAQLADEAFVGDVAHALAASGLLPGTLVLELTESTLVEDTSLVMQRLHALRSLGVQLAVDDFGTGYSSLAYLRNFPIDILKIDRRFIRDLDADGGHAALTRAILGLGATLSLRTIAEGIETEHQLDELRAMGCEVGQGFLFATPLPAAEARAYLAASLHPAGPGGAEP